MGKAKISCRGEEMTGSKRRKKQRHANRKQSRTVNWSHRKK